MILHYLDWALKDIYKELGDRNQVLENVFIIILFRTRKIIFSLNPNSYLLIPTNHIYQANRPRQPSKQLRDLAHAHLRLRAYRFLRDENRNSVENLV